MKLLNVLTAGVCLAGVAGCTSIHQPMVDSGGNMKMCSGTGYGFVGATMATYSVSRCVDTLKSLGFQEIEKCGVIGVFFAEKSSMILKVTENSPAWKAGILPRDRIVSIDGQSVNTEQEAKVLLYGKIGTEVNLVVNRKGEEIPFQLTRAQFSKVFRTN